MTTSFLYVLTRILHNIFYSIFPLLLLLRIGMETYTNSFSNIDWLDWHFSGNFLICALPIMLLGNYIHRNIDRIKNINSNIVILCGILSIILVFVNVKIGVLDISQIFKIISATFIFIICLIYNKVNFAPCISNLGRKYTLYIYLYHLVIGTFVSDLFTHYNLPTYFNDYILVFVVIILSTLLSAVLCRKKC